LKFLSTKEAADKVDKNRKEGKDDRSPLLGQHKPKDGSSTLVIYEGSQQYGSLKNDPADKYKGQVLAHEIGHSNGLQESEIRDHAKP
jgi:hypothetical protein